MKKSNLVKIFEELGFNVFLTHQDNIKCAEIESWTNRGVNMIIFLNPFTVEEFIDYVNDFDVDEEIDLHRQNEQYKKDFTIRESVTDFEQYFNNLKSIRDILIIKNENKFN